MKKQIKQGKYLLPPSLMSSVSKSSNTVNTKIQNSDYTCCFVA